MIDAVMVTSISVEVGDNGTTFHTVELAFGRASLLVEGKSDTGKVRVRLHAALTDDASQVAEKAAKVTAQLLRDFSHRFDSASAEEIVIAPPS